MNLPTLTLESARQQLRALGFYGLLAHAETLLHEPWLARVIELEEAERQQRSLKRRLNNARLGAFKPLADFDWAWPTKCDRALLEELFSLAFIDDAANVVLLGPNGLGKSMLLKNLTHIAVLHGHTARFTLAAHMLHASFCLPAYTATMPPNSLSSSPNSLKRSNDTTSPSFVNAHTARSPPSAMISGEFACRYLGDEVMNRDALREPIGDHCHRRRAQAPPAAVNIPVPPGPGIKTDAPSCM